MMDERAETDGRLSGDGVQEHGELRLLAGAAGALLRRCARRRLSHHRRSRDLRGE